MDPEFPTVDLRNALAAGLVHGPRLIVAAHIISASAGHGDLRGFYPSRWDIPVSTIADGTQEIRRLVRREHAYGSDWIKTANAGGYFSVGDDPARPPGSTRRWRLCAQPHSFWGCPSPCTPVPPMRASRRSATAPAA
jgi:imidazolonepropionase-like amidohydrolase